ncbi:tape measure protein [Pseudomonas japonica]|uniref:tape measure protein n=1 Tax=Pseudomonas japonica TaxID=256466 RepID=UPI003A8A6109
MASGQTLRSLIVSVSAETGAYQREMARASRMGSNYLRTITEGNQRSVTSWRSQQSAIEAQTSALQSLTAGAGEYARAMAAALAAGSLVTMADAWGSVNARLRMASTSQADFLGNQKAIFDISQKTGTAFAANANMFSRSSASMREFGYSSADALSITEVLATGLQLSGANAEETTSTITQFSQALAAGVLRGEEFNTVNTSADRVIRALAAGMGVQRKALKGMADDGKLTIDKVVPALISQLGVLRDEYKQMPNSVASGFTTLKNAMEAWLGGMNGATGTTTSLSAALTLAAENFDLLAAAAGAAAVAYGAKRSLEVVGALREQVIASRAAAAAEVGRTAAQVDAAATALRVAQADAIAAQRRVAFSTTTAEAALATRALTAAKLAELEATRALTAAQAANTAAASLGARVGAGLLSLLGGPIGLAALVAGTAASFLLFSSNASAANTSAADLRTPISELRKEWEALGNAQRRPILDKLIAEQAAAQREAAELAKQMEEIVRPSVGGYLSGDRFQANQYQRSAAATNFRRSVAGGIDIDRATQSVISSTKPYKEVQAELEGMAGKYQQVIGKAGLLGDQINALNGVMASAADGAQAVSKSLNSIQPPSPAVTTAWEKRIEALVEQTAKLKDPTELGEINRLAAKDNLSQTAEGKALLAKAQAAAAAKDAEEKAKKSREDAATKAKQAATAAAQQAKQLNDSYERTLRSLHEQADVHGQKTELAKVEFDTTKGTLSKLDQAKKTELERAAIAVDHLNTQKSFKDLMGEVQTQENSLLATTRKRYAELERLKKQGGLSTEQYAEATTSISKASIEKAPKFDGLDASVTGASGELIKTAEAEAQLRKWHGRQLQMQSELLAEVLANQESTNEQRLAAEQRYLDRVTEINQTSSKRLASIQDSYRVAVVSTFSELSGQAADMVGKIAGEQSGAYKALFIAQKAFAVASIIMNAQIAAAKAPAELTVLGGIKVGAALLAAGYANAGMVAGMALAGFSEGGYTGPGGKLEPKGVVHGGEVVIRKEVVDQPGMKDYLVGLNRTGLRGYATGGFVGGVSGTPPVTVPSVSSDGAVGGAPQINININSDGTGGSVETTAGYEAMGQALLATVREEMPKVARGVIIREKGQNGLLDPSNRRND